MELKKLEKASKILERVKQLDKEIIAIDKKANLILDNETEITFNLRIENKKIKNKSKKQPEENIRTHVDIFNMFHSFHKIAEEKIKNEVVINSEKIDDKTALAILGVMLNKKNNERLRLINQIETIFQQ